MHKEDVLGRFELVNNLYGIRLGDWVEIRTHSSLPRKQTTSIKIPSKVRQFNPNTNRYQLVKGEVELKTRIYGGGSILGQIPFLLFSRLTRTFMLKDTIYKIPKEFNEEILAKLKK